MKKQRPQKEKEGTQPPADQDKINIPASLQKLAEKSEKDNLLAYFGPLLAVPEVGPRIAGLLSGLFDVGIPVPEWAKMASKKIFGILGFDFEKIREIDEKSPAFFKIVGEIIGVAEETKKNEAHPDSIAGRIENEITEPTVKFTKEIASNAEPEKSAAFFQGRLKSANKLEKIKELPQRAKIYAVIAVGWPEIQKFRSTGELHSWLLSHKRPDGNAVFAPGTDARETRKICKEIGLRFQNSWRKSSPENPGHDT